MRYIKTFEKWNIKPDDILIIVDVQKSFSKFFTNKYVDELKKYCKNFNRVYQIWDNHPDGTNVDKDYLYDEDPEIPVHKDLYQFPNQKDLIEKRYNYDVDADFYKKILDKDVYDEISKKEEEKSDTSESLKTENQTSNKEIQNKQPKNLDDVVLDRVVNAYIEKEILSIDEIDEPLDTCNILEEPLIKSSKVPKCVKFFMGKNGHHKNGRPALT